MNEVRQKTPNDSTKLQALHKLCTASQNTASIDSTSRGNNYTCSLHDFAKHLRWLYRKLINTGLFFARLR